MARNVYETRLTNYSYSKIAKDRDRRWDFVNTVVKFRVQNGGKLLKLEIIKIPEDTAPWNVLYSTVGTGTLCLYLLDNIRKVNKAKLSYLQNELF